MTDQTGNVAKTNPRGKTRRPDLDSLYTVNEDGTRNFLHIADVSGRWQIIKSFSWTILLIVYAVLPWITVKGHPAVLLDIPGRHAYLLGGTFTNQDFYLVFFLISGMGFLLFVLTALLGRVWCGFACPQTVFLEAIYRKTERWLEGARETRIRRNQKPASFDSVWRKGLKHLLFIVFSFIIAHIFLSYFIPLTDLREVITGNPAEHWTAFFWSMFWTGLLYFDFAWFREQTCLIICPYGRLQSTLTDDDTIMIAYDWKRGEPRSAKHGEGGDCIDCFRCVAVCPTGIDIRNGTQMECIGCSNCIDACNAIMDRIGRPHGLVRYDSERGIAGEGEKRSLFRPRVLTYTFLMLLGMSVFTIAASHRTSLEIKVLRQSGLPFVIEGGKIRNLFTIQLQNKSDEPRVYTIREVIPDEVLELDPEFIIPTRRIALDGLGSAQIPLFAFIAREKYSNPFELGLTIADSSSGRETAVNLRFRGP